MDSSTLCALRRWEQSVDGSSTWPGLGKTEVLDKEKQVLGVTLMSTCSEVEGPWGGVHRDGAPLYRIPALESAAVYMPHLKLSLLGPSSYP